MPRRMIALLVAFSVLADRVAGRSAPVRLLVLWILRRAETAAAAYVFEEAGLPPPACDGIAAVAHSPADALRLAARFTALADALRLAARFTALAAALRALLPIACPFARRPAPRALAFGPVAPGSGHHPAGWTPAPFDTS